MAAAEIILIVAASLLVYSYAIYPMLTIMFASGKKNKSAVSATLPLVSILMPVYNEEKVIRKKTDSLIASDYPAERTEILIGSDASTDNTDLIAGEYAAARKNIKFIRSEKRAGKAAMVNRLALMASGELLVVTDANVIPERTCLGKIVSHFNDENTGLCDATPVTPATFAEGIARQEKLYSSFEMKLKNSEAKVWGTSINPYGGFYVIRKSLFPVIPENMLADDLYVGLSLITRGYKALNEEEATVSEDIPSGIYEQYKRRERIAAGSFQNLFHYGPFPGGFFSRTSFCFFSHKVLRWFTPLFLLTIFMTSIILSGHSLLYFALALVQVIFILLPMPDYLLQKMGITVVPFRAVTQFLMMNVALAAGFFRCVRGVKEGTWEPTKRV
jgi:cellulose synthase/poly-beta-1,6-N-acetylglucosamine synthase-like glycosyltransferase